MTPRRVRSIRLPLLLAVLTLTSAGCDLGFGLGPEREFEGRYEGTFTLERESFGSVGGGFECFDGTLEIRRGFGDDLSGEWRLRADGRTLRGDLENGHVDSFGEVSFVLESDFRDDLLEVLTGCRFVDGERRFHGSVFDGRLRADRVARLRCPVAADRLQTIRFRLGFSGRRDRFF